jgi:excisionase family DNA binding protein
MAIEPTSDHLFSSHDVQGSPRTTDQDLTELLTVQEAAQFLKVTVSWVYEHVRRDAEDRLPVVKLGKYLRFDPRDLSTFINAKRDAARHPRRRR